MSLEQPGGEDPAAASGISLERAFYPVYERLFDENSEFVDDVETKLAQARMNSNVEMYLARSLAIGLLAGFALWVMGAFVGWLLVQFVFGDVIIGIPLPDSLSLVFDIIQVPLILLITGLFFGAIGFGIGFGAMLGIPYMRASGREREINKLLPETIAFMYALSVGGMNQLEIVRATARAEDTYGEVSQEFQSIVLETEYFDTDYRTAVRNQALETPSDPFSQFLTDMLSILDSGGDMQGFLEDQKDKHIRTAKQEQERQLDTLELFGEMYMTLSLFPLLLIILLVIMGMMGSGSNTFMLMAAVYGLIPVIGGAFLVLVSTVTEDSIGDGYIRPDEGEDFTVEEGISVLDTELVEEYTGEYEIFDQVKARDGRYELAKIFKQPHVFFKDHPPLVLTVTLPLTLVVFLAAFATGNLPLSLGAIQDNVLYGTFIWIYAPLYLNGIPLSVFHHWNVRSRNAVMGNLSENLRKLASANDTGMTLLESLKVVSDTSSGRLSDEFEEMYAKVNYGTNLKDALREFNNKYHIPRLARTIKLVSEAQETSSHIEDVLTTAATSSENQDDIERERKSRSLMQVVIIIMTYVTLLAVMALLQVQFLDSMAGLAGGESGGGGGGGASSSSFGASIDTELLSMLFFHAVTIQALISALVAGYIRNVDIISGVKYSIPLATVALVVWIMVESITGGNGGGEEEAEALLLLALSTGPAAHVLRGKLAEVRTRVRNRVGSYRSGDQPTDRSG